MSALQELQNYTFVSKYARWLEDKNRRETWREAVDRVKNMMHTQYDDKGISEQIDWAYDLMFKKRVLGSQRALQFEHACLSHHAQNLFKMKSVLQADQSAIHGMHTFHYLDSTCDEATTSSTARSG